MHGGVYLGGLAVTVRRVREIVRTISPVAANNGNEKNSFSAPGNAEFVRSRPGIVCIGWDMAFIHRFLPVPRSGR